MGGRNDRNTVRRTKGERRRHRSLLARQETAVRSYVTDPGRRAKRRDRRVVDDLALGSGAALERERSRQQDRAAVQRPRYSEVRYGFIGPHPAMTSLSVDDPTSAVTSTPGPQPIAPLLLVVPRSPQPTASDGDPKETAQHAA